MWELFITSWKYSNSVRGLIRIVINGIPYMVLSYYIPECTQHVPVNSRNRFKEIYMASEGNCTTICTV